MRVTHFPGGTVAIVISGDTVVISVTNAIEALLPDEAVVIGLTKRGTLTGTGWIKRGPGRKVAVFTFRAVTAGRHNASCQTLIGVYLVSVIAWLAIRNLAITAIASGC